MGAYFLKLICSFIMDTQNKTIMCSVEEKSHNIFQHSNGWKKVKFNLKGGNENGLDMCLGKEIIIAERSFYLEPFCSISQLAFKIFILSYIDEVN
jgi:hypothetical protein